MFAKCKINIMENTYSPTIGRLSVGSTDLCFVDLPESFGPRLQRLPVVLRLLLENVLRHTEGAEQTAAMAAILGWLDTGMSEAEIPYQPGRVLMHDTTSTPALVDIAAMQEVTKIAVGSAPKRNITAVLP